MYYIKRLINKIASAQIIIALVAHLLEDGHTSEHFVFSSDRPTLFIRNLTAAIPNKGVSYSGKLLVDREINCCR